MCCQPHDWDGPKHEPERLGSSVSGTMWLPITSSLSPPLPRGLLQVGMQPPCTFPAVVSQKSGHLHLPKDHQGCILSYILPFFSPFGIPPPPAQLDQLCRVTTSRNGLLRVTILQRNWTCFSHLRQQVCSNLEIAAAMPTPRRPDLVGDWWVTCFWHHPRQSLPKYVCGKRKEGLS